MTTDESKLSRLRAAWAIGDAIGVLRIAARFPRLGGERDAITRAWAAVQNPDLYEQMGDDPAVLVAAGLRAVGARYALGPIGRPAAGA